MYMCPQICIHVYIYIHIYMHIIDTGMGKISLRMISSGGDIL